MQETLLQLLKAKDAKKCVLLLDPHLLIHVAKAQVDQESYEKIADPVDRICRVNKSLSKGKKSKSDRPELKYSESCCFWWKRNAEW